MVIEKKSKLDQALDNTEQIDLTLSYSKLSDFDRNGSVSLIRQSNVDNDGVKFGSLVDDLLFNDKDYFNEHYYIFDGEKPTATLGTLCDIILKNYLTIPTIDDIVNIIVLNKFWANIKNQDTLIEKFNNEEFWNYLKCKYDTVNKTVITSKEYEDSKEIIHILKTHKYSKHILINDYENISQLKFSIKYRKFKINGILDLISIDHKNKIVYFTDLKTGKNPAIEFEESFIKWRYYFQGAIYCLAFFEICKTLGLKDYKLAPFQFLYISKSDKTPLLFKMTEKWIKAAMNGFSINRYKFKGINELIDEIYWCWKNKEYNITKYIVENNGIINLKDNFIEINE